MNHYVCCPLIVLSGALHTGTNQLPWMKHDLQADFWEAREVFRKEGEPSFSMICFTFQMCPPDAVDGQEVKQHTFWTDLPWPFLSYLFLKDVFRRVVDPNVGYVRQYVNLLLFRLWVWMDNLLLWCLETEQASGSCMWWAYRCEHCAPGHRPCLPAQLPAHGPGQHGSAVGDLSCAGCLWIPACLTGCPLCWLPPQTGRDLEFSPFQSHHLLFLNSRPMG